MFSPTEPLENDMDNLWLDTVHNHRNIPIVFLDTILLQLI